MSHNWTALAVLAVGGSALFLFLYVGASRELHYRDYLRRKRPDMLPLASRSQRKKMLAVLGFDSMRAFKINTTTQPGTVMRIATWLETIRGVRSVRFGPPSPAGTVFVILTMRWWAWLAFGWMHRRARLQATQIVMREKPAAADFVVAFDS